MPQLDIVCSRGALELVVVDKRQQPIIDRFNNAVLEVAGETPTQLYAQPAEVACDLLVEVILWCQRNGVDYLGAQAQARLLVDDILADAKGPRLV